MAGEVAESFSFNRSIGQLYAFLYISAAPLSLEDIADACRMSKGNASIHLRTLEHWGAVRKSWRPGTRKDYYTANTDLKELALRRLQEGLGKRISQTRDKFNTFKALLGGAHGANEKEHSSEFSDRLQNIDVLLGQVEKGLQMLPSLAKLQKFL